jgi:four helix bundle protein
MARNFKSIIAWQKADDLAVEIYRETGKSFPSDERFGLTSQIRRAAASIPANIAEGSGRETLKDFARFLHNAQGSLSEVEYFLHLAKRLNYFSEDTFKNLEDQRAEVGRLLNGFIKSIKQRIYDGERT